VAFRLPPLPYRSIDVPVVVLPLPDDIQRLSRSWVDIRHRDLTWAIFSGRIPSNHIPRVSELALITRHSSNIEHCASSLYLSSVHEEWRCKHPSCPIAEKSNCQRAVGARHLTSCLTVKLRASLRSGQQDGLLRLDGCLVPVRWSGA
jgi:hypothetical protein